MKFHVRALAIPAAIALTLAGCAANDEKAPVSTSSTSTVSTTSTTSPNSTTSSASSTEQSPSNEDIDNQRPNPTTSANQSDSAEQRTGDDTFTTPGNGYQCPGTDAFVNDPADCTPENLGGQPAPEDTVPYDDGGTCPAYLCGYGTDENGAPNPSSGEIQSWWANCTSQNSEEYCRENDPYMN